MDPNKRYDILNCNAAIKTYDCFDIAGGVDVKDLVWVPITRTVTKCSLVLPAGDYNENCTINSLSTHGELSSAPGVAVLSITARTASQPLLIDGVKHTPDNAKFDVRIQYPWANKTLSDATNAKIALLAVHAGKAGVAGVGVKDGGTTKSLTFAADGGKAAYFSYVSVAKINNADTPITTETITAEEIQGFDCTAHPCGFTQLLVDVGLKPLVTWLQGFHWQPRITVHAFSVKQPVDIFWDPELGVEEITKETSSAAIVVPAVGMLVALLF